MTHTQKKKIDRKREGQPLDARQDMKPWSEVKRTGQPGDRGVTRRGLVRTIPGKPEGQATSQKER